MMQLDWSISENIMLHRDLMKCRNVGFRKRTKRLQMNACPNSTKFVLADTDIYSSLQITLFIPTDEIS
jgi:hypothetical protein